MKNTENTVDHIDKEPQVYEVGYHIVPIVSEDDLGARVTAIRDVLEAHGAVSIADEYPKHMDLTYEMVKVASNKRAKYTSAYFGWIKFQTIPSEIKAIEEGLRKNDDILRFILVKTVRENTMVSKKILMHKRGEERPEEPKAPVVEKPALSAEELDKTIENLVIE